MGRIVKGGRVVAAETFRALGEAEAIREEARQRGLERGLAEAAATLVAARLTHQRRLQGLENDVVTLALEIARKLLRHQVEAEPQAVARIYRQALEQVTMADAVMLRVNPEDLAALGDVATSVAGVLNEPGGLEVVADEAIERGGCVVETELGRIDARLETQLGAIERALVSDHG